jgi:hypothetical protein
VCKVHLAFGYTDMRMGIDAVSSRSGLMRPGEMSGSDAWLKGIRTLGSFHLEHIHFGLER